MVEVSIVALVVSSSSYLSVTCIFAQWDTLIDILSYASMEGCDSIESIASCDSVG